MFFDVLDELVGLPDAQLIERIEANELERRQRLFTGSSRQAAKLVVKQCEHIGCVLPADWCDVDHVDEWDRDLGATSQRNSAVLCRSHNNDKHQQKWRTRRALNGCSYTVRADGSAILPVGARPPGFADSSDDEPDSPEEFARTAIIARNRLAEHLRQQS